MLGLWYAGGAVAVPHEDSSVTRDKRHRWREKVAGKEKEFLQNHVVPVVTGPKGRHYIIDHHHLVRALHDEGVTTVYVTTVVDLSRSKRMPSGWCSTPAV